MLEDDILVVVISQEVFAGTCLLGGLLGLTLCVGRLCSFLLLPYGFFGGSVSLLLCRHLLQAVEFLSVQLVQLRVDVLDRVLGSWDDDVLAGTC